MSERDELPRELGLLDAILIVIGVVIGSGIFLLPNLIARSIPSATAIIAVWIGAGILSFFGALAYAELGAMLPATGGQYVFLREAYGPMCAFLCGWVFVLAAAPGGIAFLAVGFSIYLDRLVPLTPYLRTAASIALVVTLSAINYVGVTESAWVQRVFTTPKIAGLLLIIGVAIFSERSHAVQPSGSPQLGYTGFGVALAACLMAYNGWSYVSFVAGEVRNPGRNLPRSLVLGMLAVMLLYISANLAYFRMMSVGEIAASERVGSDVAARLMGPAGERLLSAIVLLSVIGAINGCILTAARIPFAQARDGLFFARFGTVHGRFKTPAFAIAAQAVWTVVLILTGSYATLSSYTILSAWFFYTLSVAAVWILRRRLPYAVRPYRMWGFPGTVYVFVAVSVWFMGDAIVNQPRPSVMALLIAGAGVPFYYLWRSTHPVRKIEPAALPGPHASTAQEHPG